jgi:hypothetical protein
LYRFKALFRGAAGSKLYASEMLPLSAAAVVLSDAAGLRLYSGSIQALFRLYSGYIQALFRLYPGSIQALFRLYSDSSPHG